MTGWGRGRPETPTIAMGALMLGALPEDLGSASVRERVAGAEHPASSKATDTYESKREEHMGALGQNNLTALGEYIKREGYLH